MSGSDRWRSDYWLSQRLEQLDALFTRYGTAGLKEFKDAHLLLWWKQLELRDGAFQGEERRLLEIEVKQLASYLKDRQRERKPEQAIEHKRSRGLRR